MAGIDLPQRLLVPYPLAVPTPAPAEIPRAEPRPELLPSFPETITASPKAAPARGLEEGVEPFSTVVPKRQLNHIPSSSITSRPVPKPQPEPQPLRQRASQATENQGKRKREPEFGEGSDTEYPDRKRMPEERKVLLESPEERQKKKEKRRIGRRVARRVIAGEIGSITLEEDQQSEYDKNQFTSSRTRTSEGRDES